MIILPIGDDNEGHRTPVVTLLIILLCCLAYFGLDEKTTLQHCFYPALPSLQDAVTALFLHASLLHLFGNMLFFWIVADNVEDKFGHLGFLLFFLAAGVVGNYVDVLIDSGFRVINDVPVPALGASGAIAGVMGAYLVMFPRARIKMWGCFFYIFTFTFFLPTIIAIGTWFVLQALDHMTATKAGEFTGIGYTAHIGGFLFGAVVTLLLIFTGRIRTNWRSSMPEPEPGQVVSNYPFEKAGKGKCPACLSSLTEEQCQVCGGLWLTAERLTELRQTSVPDVLLHPRQLKPAASSRRPPGTRQCPVCQKKLAQDHQDGVAVEVCPSEHGQWLDRGQLLRLTPL